MDQQRIVVGYESAERSGHVLAAAVDLAARLEAGLDIVHVRDAVVSPAASSAVGLPMDVGGAVLTAPLPRERVAELEAELTREVAERVRGVEATVRVVQGWPPDALRSAADDADAYLVVVGGPGQGFGAFLDHLVSGSVAHELERRCPRPVVVVPAPD